jgi:hypothetical protein
LPLRSTGTRNRNSARNLNRRIRLRLGIKRTKLPVRLQAALVCFAAAIADPPRVVYQFEFLPRWRHPERSRFSGGESDLPIHRPYYGRFLGPLVKTRAVGMTPTHDAIQTDAPRGRDSSRDFGLPSGKILGLQKAKPGAYSVRAISRIRQTNSFHESRISQRL